MLIKKLTLKNKLGLHARAAAKLVNEAARYACHITLKYGNKEANGKSIIEVMTLAATQGAELEVRITGIDGADALTAIETLIEHRFGEKE